MTPEDQEALDRFKRLPKEEQKRLLAETVHKLLSNRDAMNEFVSILAPCVSRGV